MTRQELTGTRSLEFSAWIRKNCPGSESGFCVGNLDWIFWDWKKRRLLLIEEKTHNSVNFACWMKRLMTEVFVPALERFCADNDIEFRGFHIVRFEKNSPSDCRIWLDDVKIDEKAFRLFLDGYTEPF